MSATVGDKITALRTALKALVDPNPCRLDHGGFCQEHGSGAPCAHAEARRVLKETAGGRWVYPDACDECKRDGSECLHRGPEWVVDA